MIDCQSTSHTTCRQRNRKEGKKETREEEKLMAIVRTIATMSDFSIILFVFLYISSIKELSNSKTQKKKLIYIYKYTTISLLLLIYTSICVCVHALKVPIMILTYSRSNQFFLNSVIVFLLP